MKLETNYLLTKSALVFKVQSQHAKLVNAYTGKSVCTRLKLEPYKHVYKALINNDAAPIVKV